MREDQICPLIENQINLVSKHIYKDRYVPELFNILEIEEDLDLNNIQNNHIQLTELDDDMDVDVIDICLVFEVIKFSNTEINVLFKYLDINQIIEYYPFEEQNIRLNPRNTNLTTNNIIEICSYMNINNIIERMNLLATNQYYVIFEQVI